MHMSFGSEFRGKNAMLTLLLQVYDLRNFIGKTVNFEFRTKILHISFFSPLNVTKYTSEPKILIIEF